MTDPQSLVRFLHISSNAQQALKFNPTALFLSYSIAEKTLSVLSEFQKQPVPFDYWAICCIFTAINYVENKSPKITQFQMFCPILINASQYKKYQRIILQKIGFNLTNCTQALTLIQQYLNYIKEENWSFFFYYMQLALFYRDKLGKFSVKEIITAVAFEMAHNAMPFCINGELDGIKHGKIRECSIMIYKLHITYDLRQQKLKQKYSCSWLNYASIAPIPKSQDLIFHLFDKAIGDIMIFKTEFTQAMKYHAKRQQDEKMQQIGKCKIESRKKRERHEELGKEIARSINERFEGKQMMFKNRMGKEFEDSFSNTNDSQHVESQNQHQNNQNVSSDMQI